MINPAIFALVELQLSHSVVAKEVCPIGLQVPTHLIGAARFRVRVRGVLSEVRDSVAQHGELRDLLLDLSEAHVKQVAHVLAGRMAAVADVEDLADLGEGEARGLAAVDEVDPSDRLGRVVAVSGRRALGRGQKALFLVEAKGLRGSARPLGEFSDPHCCLPPWPRLTFPCTGRSSMAETEQKAKS